MVRMKFKKTRMEMTNLATSKKATKRLIVMELALRNLKRKRMVTLSPRTSIFIRNSSHQSKLIDLGTRLTSKDYTKSRNEKVSLYQ